MNEKYLHFRIASAADLEIILAMMRGLYAQDHLAFDENAARRALQQILNDEALGRIWLICQDEEIIGYVALCMGFSLEYHGRDAFIDEIYIHEAHRGQGVGRRALAFVEEACRQLGVQALHLEVERANVSAQAAYRKAGFIDHDRYLMTKWMAQTPST